MLEKEISNNIEQYQGKEQWVEKFFISKDMPNYCFDSKIEVADYKLINGGPETDFENAKIIYEVFFPYINPVQASDLRLWAYLAHIQHWDYMTVRWKIDEEDDQLEERKTEIDRIGYRYFFKASRGKAFVRQGISRLFWGAYLTYDKDNENPYEYTEYFFSKQDIFTSITERSFARNKVLVLAALKEMKNSELSRKEVRDFLAKLNQAGAITVLDSLEKVQAENLCKSVMNEIKNASVLK